MAAPSSELAWLQLVSNGMGIAPEELRVVALGGIPDALRGPVWMKLAGAQPGYPCVPPHAQDRPCDADDAIDRDLQRTFPFHSLFEADGSLGQAQLSLVLRYVLSELRARALGASHEND